jgi:D-alanyl-D-alanine carboxypeptidase
MRWPLLTSSDAPRPRRWPAACTIAALAATAVAVLPIVPACSRQAPAPDATACPPAVDRLDAYVRARMEAEHLPGLSLAVVRDGKVVLTQAYGLANLEWQVPATTQTVYEVGSISKQIAANAILLLVEEGRVGLDDPLSKYIDGTPPAWSAITVRHVLTHTAGLADFDSGDIGFSYRREYTPAEFVELLGKQPLQFAPGERWNYTNAFPLLGMVVERASGQPYMAFVEQRIFARLNLASMRFKKAQELVPSRADGYVFENGGYHHGERLRPAVIAPNGGVMTSVLDFAAWDIALTSGRLLKPETVEAMATPVRLNDGRTVSHGLGWFMDRFNGHRFGAHWGTTVTGYSAVVRRYVDDHVTVLVLANGGHETGQAVDKISKCIANMYVSGVIVQGLTPQLDPDAAGTARLKALLGTVADGRDDPAAPGLGTRLPPPVRERLGAALRTATAFEYLGEEQVDASHFTNDPALARNRWYRATTPAGRRYLTLRLSSASTLLGVLIEDE